MESSPLTPVAPVRPVFPYVGGKRNLSRQLVALIETVPHVTYAEPFLGGGGIFLRRRARPKAEVINDWSRDVVTFFRILQRHYPAFRDELRFRFSSRAEFDRLLKVDPETLTDLERATRFLYLQNLAFGGKVAGRNFGVAQTRPGRFDLARLGPMLEDLHDRLSGVTIECLPYDAFIGRYDREGALFYCDPPYFGSEDYYGAELFSRAEFVRLAETLRGIRGRFILSINDVPEIRELFAWAQLTPVGVSYSVSGQPSNARELIIQGPT